MKSFKRFMSEAETRVGSSVFKLSKPEMKELRRIVKKSGSKVLSVASLAARPKVARDMIRKHGNASVLEERQPKVSGNKAEATKAIRALETKLSQSGGSKRKELQSRIDSLRKQAGIKEQTLNESLMKAEFSTPEGADGFAKDFAASGLTGRVTRTKKMGRMTEVEFLARPVKAKEISKLAKKNKGSLTFMG